MIPTWIFCNIFNGYLSGMCWRTSWTWVPLTTPSGTRPHPPRLAEKASWYQHNILMISIKIRYWQQPLLPQGRGEKHPELREVARGRVERCKVAKDICLFVCLFVEEELRCTVNNYKNKQTIKSNVHSEGRVLFYIGYWGSPTIRIFEGRCLDAELRQEVQGKSTSLR